MRKSCANLHAKNKCVCQNLFRSACADLITCGWNSSFLLMIRTSFDLGYEIEEQVHTIEASLLLSSDKVYGRFPMWKHAPFTIENAVWVPYVMHLSDSPYSHLTLPPWSLRFSCPFSLTSRKNKSHHHQSSPPCFALCPNSSRFSSSGWWTSPSQRLRIFQSPKRMCRSFPITARTNSAPVSVAHWSCLLTFLKRSVLELAIRAALRCKQ